MSTPTQAALTEANRLALTNSLAHCTLNVEILQPDTPASKGRWIPFEFLCKDAFALDIIAEHLMSTGRHRMCHLLDPQGRLIGEWKNDKAHVDPKERKVRK
jgi:hypothetical protein